MITAIVVPASARRPVSLQQIKPSDLGAMQRLVGGMLDCVSLDNPRAGMYIDDNGKNNGLPGNPRATLLMWAHNSAMRGRDVIVGPAVLVGPPNRRGDDKTVPQHYIDVLTRPDGLYGTEYRLQGECKWRTDESQFPDSFMAYSHIVQIALEDSTIEDVRIKRLT